MKRQLKHLKKQIILEEQDTCLLLFQLNCLQVQVYLDQFVIVVTINYFHYNSRFMDYFFFLRIIVFRSESMLLHMIYI